VVGTDVALPQLEASVPGSEVQLPIFYDKQLKKCSNTEEDAGMWSLGPLNK